MSAHHLWLANSIGEQAQHTNKLKQPFMARRIKSEFDKAVELDPTSIDARHGLIQFYSQAPGVMGGSMDKAKEQAREIEKLNAMRGHFEMARCSRTRTRISPARSGSTRRRWPRRRTATSRTTASRSFYRRQKRYAEAIAVYERLLKAQAGRLQRRI